MVREPEKVIGLKDFRPTGRALPWLRLAVDDSPLLLRDVGTEDVYALGGQAP